MTTYHESLEDYDSVELWESDAEQDARDGWAEVTLNTLADTQLCDFCACECLTPLSPVVSGAPQGYAMHRRGGEAFACEGCVEDAGEAGWNRA